MYSDEYTSGGSRWNHRAGGGRKGGRDTEERSKQSPGKPERLPYFTIAKRYMEKRYVCMYLDLIVVLLELLVLGGNVTLTLTCTINVSLHDNCPVVNTLK